MTGNWGRRSLVVAAAMLASNIAPVSGDLPFGAGSGAGLIALAGEVTGSHPNTEPQVVDTLLIDLPAGGARLLTPTDGVVNKTVSVSTVDGSAISFTVAWSQPWLTVSPDSSVTPVDLDLSADASGLAPGRYQDVLTLTSVDAGNSPLDVGVELFVGGVIALDGDPTLADIGEPGEADTFYVDLPDGAVVDIAAFPTDGSTLPWLDLVIMDADGNHHRYGDWRPLPERVSGRIVGAWTVEGPGPHQIMVENCCYTGEYEVKARTSAAIVATDPWSRLQLGAPEGSAQASDTVWVYNLGVGSANWEVVPTQPWLSAVPSSGTLGGGGEAAQVVAGPAAARAQEYDRAVRAWIAGGEGADVAPPKLGVVDDPALAPAGSVEVVVTADIAGLVKGQRWFEDALVFRLTDDAWGGDALMDLDLRIFEPTITILAEGLPYRTADLALLPDGDLVMASQGNLERVDPTTGARSAFASGLSQDWGLSGLVAAPDGSVYVVDTSGQEILRAYPDGSFETVWALGGDYLSDVTLAPDGTVYAVADQSGLWRIDTDGSVANVANEDGCCHRAVVFNPLDGLVYYSAYNRLYRYEPSSGAVEHAVWLWDWPGDLDVGSSGLIYAHSYSDIRAYGTDGTQQARFATPDQGEGLAVLDGALFATTPGCCDNRWNEGILYRLPVADGPVALGGRYLVADQLRSYTVLPGEVLTDRITMSANDGGTMQFEATWSAPWLDVSPSAGLTPAEVELTIDATELTGGTYSETIVFSSTESTGSLARHVTVVVPTTLIAGDSLIATMPIDQGSQTQYIDMIADDVVDIGVFAVPGSAIDPSIRILHPDGSFARGSRAQPALRRVSPNGELVAGFEATQTGVHEVRVFASPGGTYVLRTRISGDLVAADPQRLDAWAPEGGLPVVDTVWLYNTGPGTPTWELVGELPGWLSLSATSGILAPSAVPAAEAGGVAFDPDEGPPFDPELIPLGPESITARPPPAGATALVVTADPTGLAQADQLDATLEFTVLGETAYGNQTVHVELTATDPTLTVLTNMPYRLMDVQVYSATELVATRNRDLWRVDRTTGAATVWIENLGVDAGTYPTPVLGIEHAGDGALYVADQAARAIYRVEADGSSSTVMDVGSTTYDPVILPDGTLIAAAFQGFFRLEPDGSVTEFAHDETIKRAVYNPHDGWIYYGSFFGRELKRVHPETGWIEVVASLPEVPFDLQVGASGGIHWVSHTGTLYVHSAEGELLDVSSPAPRSGFGIALGAEGEDVAYLAAQGFIGGNGYIYQRTVADHRALNLMAGPPTILVMSGSSSEATVHVRASDASVQGFSATSSAPWLTVTPDTADTPADVVLTVDASGLASGGYDETVTLTSGGVVGPYDVPVRVNVGVVVVLGGDPVVADLGAPGEADTFHVSLPVGEAVDIAAFPTEGSTLPWLDLLIMDADGNHHRYGDWRPMVAHSAGSVIGNWIVSGPSPYRIVVQNCCEAGPYEVKARLSGPIVATDPQGGMTLSAPEGGAPAVDTVWVFNLGSGAADWEVVSTQPWLSAAPASGALSGPSASPPLTATSEASAGPRHAERVRLASAEHAAADGEPRLTVFTDPTLAPPGSVPVEITADVAGMAKGSRYFADALEFRLPTDPWGGDVVLDVELFVHEPSITVVADAFHYFTGDVARHPDGDLVVATAGRVERVDPVTGERSVLAGGVAPDWALRGIAVAPDGAVYVVDAESHQIKRVTPRGVVTSVWTLEGDDLYDVTLTPRGNLYAVGWSTGLWRIDPVLREGSLVASGGDCCHHSVVFNPTDGLVYYSFANQLYRYDPEDGSNELVVHANGWHNDLDVGSSGLVYSTSWDFGIRAYDRAGVERARYAIPDDGWGLAVMEGALFATTDGCCENRWNEGIVYQLPVPDGPAALGGRFLTAEQVSTLTLRPGETAADTLILSTNDRVSVAFAVEFGQPWLTVSSDTDATPAEVVFTVDASGLTGGTYADTVVFSSEFVDGALVRIVNLEVPSLLAVGDSVVGTIPLDRGDHRQLISLTAGQVVDVGAFRVREGESVPWILLFGPDESIAAIGRRRVTPDGSLVAGFAAGETGTYEVRVFGPSGSSYLMRTRLTGDLVASEPERLDMWASGAGASVTDTIWLYNTGSGSPTWELLGTLPPWLSASAVSGTLNPASAPVATPAAELARAGEQDVDPTLIPLEPSLITKRPPPPGATPVIFMADPSGLEVGNSLLAEVQFAIAGESGVGNQPLSIELTAVDPTLEIVTPMPYRLMDVFVYSPTELVATNNRDLWKIDRATGAATAWIPNLGVDAGTYPSPVLGVEHAGDGALYVADQSARAIYLVEADGTSSTVMELPSTTYDPVVLPDGTLIASTFAGFYRLERDGSVTMFAEDRTLKRAVYNPQDGWVYYNNWGARELKRVHPVTGRIEIVGSTPAVVLDLQVGASGRLYATESDGRVRTYSTAGELVEELGGSPRTGLGLALGAEGEDVLFIASQGFFGGNGHIYKRTVADFRAPMPDAPTVTAWVEDGVAFSAAALTLGVYVDLAATGKSVGAVDGHIRWDPSKAEIVSLGQADFTGSFEINLADADSGLVSFAGINVSDTANAGSTRVAELTLVLTAPGGETVLVELTLESLESVDFVDLTPGLWIRDGLATVALGHWGDPTRDGTITAFDALVCLTHTVGRPLPPEFQATACDVAPDLDVDGNGTRETFDGTVTALDALAILSHVVLKTLPAEFRVGSLR